MAQQLADRLRIGAAAGARHRLPDEETEETRAAGAVLRHAIRKLLDHRTHDGLERIPIIELPEVAAFDNGRGVTAALREI